MAGSVFRVAKRVLTGKGAAENLGAEIDRLGCVNPLVVSDRVLEKTGLLENINAFLGDRRHGVFLEVSPEPEPSVVESAKAQFIQGEHDGLVAVGGGSVIDTAKIVSAYARLDCPLKDLFAPDSIPAKGFPLVAIPTTAGTGSEVTNIAVLSDQEARLKRGMVSDHMLPDVALVSPEMTLTMPPSVTAASGVDALVHAVEAYISRNASPITDGLALKAIALIAGNLAIAYREPGNLEAREGMSTGSLMAGMAFGNAGVGAVHALAYPLGGRFHVPHGVSNALLLPYVMQWNRVACPERFKEIALAMGEPVWSLPASQAAERAVAAMEALCRSVEIPAGMRVLDIPESAIPSMAEDASKIDRLMRNNPRQLSIQDIEAIYRLAY